MTMKPLLMTIPFMLALAGCASTTSTASTPANQPSAQVALEMANTTTDTTQANYLLDAADQYLNNHQRDLAAKAFERIQVNDLKPNEKNTWQLTKARLAFNNKHYAHALADLDASNFQPGLTPDQQTLIHLLQARAYAGLGNIQQALEAYGQSLQTTSPKQQMPTLVRLWRLLQDTPATTLQTIQSKPDLSMQAQGWLALALMVDQASDPKMLAQQLSQWKKQFPNHPANNLIELNHPVILPAPHHITLMLPLTGPLATSGQAIRNAFFASFYQRKQTANKLHIDVVDTQSAPVQQLYQQALANGSDFIVGPLTKTNVIALAQLQHFTVPVLALNSLPPGDAAIPNFYQFGLSPIDEATQTAQRAWKEGNGPASALIMPDNTWGNGINQAFTNQWQSLGGLIRASMRYSDRQSLYAKIQTLLQLNQSHTRTRLLENTLGEHVRALPRIRQDINMIFMAAMPDMARQIAPLLKFYYAGGIPVYALSTIYTGQPYTATDRDLNGVIFSDMPFVLLKHFPTTFPYAKVRALCKTLYPKNFPTHQKLYALGIDAFNLTQQLSKLQMLPQLGVYGASGQLYLTPNNAIYRRLLWAQMLRGAPHLLVN